MLTVDRPTVAISLHGVVIRHDWDNNICHCYYRPTTITESAVTTAYTSAVPTFLQ